MTTQLDFITELRTKIAALPTTRDPLQNFLPHETSDSFETSPIAGADGFHVRAGAEIPGISFGVQGTKRFQQTFVALLGHHPGGSEKERESWRLADANKVSELEFGPWNSAGIEAVFFDGSDVSRDNPNWWITTIFFRVEFTQTRVI